MKNLSAHSHISSLGVKNFAAEDTPNSIIGQKKAREGLSIILECVKQKKMTGKAVIFCGKTGIGKTALAVALSKELGNRPFVNVSASEFTSSEIKKTQVITEAFRSAILVKIKDVKQIYEGEIVELKMGKEIEVSLRSNSGIKTVTLPKNVENQFLEQKICRNDVIFVEKATGIVQRLGRSESKKSCDIDTEIYLPLPKNVESTKEIVQTLSLHELDVVTAKPKNQISKILDSHFKKKSELTEKLRETVDAIVDNYVNCGLGEVFPGVLFVDEAHLLDLESITFMNKMIESVYSPVFIFSTNKNLETFPADFIDRCLIIQPEDYSIEEKLEIVKRRLTYQEIKFGADIIEELKEIILRSGLRRALNLTSLVEDENLSLEKLKELDFLFE